MEFSVKITAEDLYAFNMRRTYTSNQGIASILCAIVVAILAVLRFMDGEITYGLVCAIGAVVILVYIPLSLWGKVKLTMKTNAVFADTLQYKVDDEGIKVSQNDASDVLAWDSVFKVTNTKKYIFVHSNKINAFVLPKAQLEDETADFMKMVVKKVPKYRRNF